MTAFSTLKAWSDEMLAREKGLAGSLDNVLGRPDLMASLSVMQALRELLTAAEAKLHTGPDGQLSPQASDLWAGWLPPASFSAWSAHNAALSQLRQRWTDLFIAHATIITDRIDTFIAQHETGILSILEDAAKQVGEKVGGFVERGVKGLRDALPDLPSFGTIGFVLLGLALVAGVALTAGIVLRG